MLNRSQVSVSPHVEAASRMSRNSPHLAARVHDLSFQACWLRCLHVLTFVATNHLFTVLIISFLVCHEEGKSWLLGGQCGQGSRAPWAGWVCVELSSQMTTLILPPDEKLTGDLVSS